jgi:hypothetical protein
MAFGVNTLALITPKYGIMTCLTSKYFKPRMFYHLIRDFEKIYYGLCMVSMIMPINGNSN